MKEYKGFLQPNYISFKCDLIFKILFETFSLPYVFELIQWLSFTGPDAIKDCLERLNRFYSLHDWHSDQRLKINFYKYRNFVMKWWMNLLLEMIQWEMKHWDISQDSWKRPFLSWQNCKLSFLSKKMHEISLQKLNSSLGLSTKAADYVNEIARQFPKLKELELFFSGFPIKRESLRRLGEEISCQLNNLESLRLFFERYLTKWKLNWRILVRIQ